VIKGDKMNTYRAGTRTEISLNICNGRGIKADIVNVAYQFSYPV